MLAQPQSWPAAAEGCTVQLPQLPAHHVRNCKICHHPDRGLIEFKFLRWHKATEIAHEFGLYDRHNVYRHARAAGLYQRRRRELFPLYERMIENFDFTKISSRDILVAAQRLERHVTEQLTPDGVADRSQTTRVPSRPTFLPAATPAPPQPSRKRPRSIAPGCAASTPEVADSKDPKIPEPHQNEFLPKQEKHPLPGHPVAANCPEPRSKQASLGVWLGWPCSYPPIQAISGTEKCSARKDLHLHNLLGSSTRRETFSATPG